MKFVWAELAAENRVGLVSLANGDPDPSLYPFRKFEFEIPDVKGRHVDPVPHWRTHQAPSQTLRAYKDAAIERLEHPEESEISLTIGDAFQYTHGAGLPATQLALGELANAFHRPPNHVVTLTLGNSDGVTKAFRLLGERGEWFLTEEFSFPGMTNAPLAYGIRWVGVKMDREGLIPGELDKVLREWDETRGKRPHVLYIVPCGQNPTGSTLSLRRRQKIYDIARDWDLIIIEDDPYYFLQYDLPSVETSLTTEDFVERYAETLVPSFVSMDVDGRVIRIDSFSKVIAPGMRLGWILSNEMFHHHLVKYTDSASQHPHGFGQIFVTGMLSKRGWGLDGFVLWMQSLCKDYQRRRDLLLEVFRNEVEPSGLASINCAQAGMFAWIKINLEGHPRYRCGDAKEVVVETGGHQVTTRCTTNVPLLMEELLSDLRVAGLIVMPAALFAIPDAEMDDVPSLRTSVYDRCSFFRATFCGTDEAIRAGMGKFGQALEVFFKQ
ncbi:hypothetical protein HGRIS_012953 [Hohenbuehelia grisea]|uniref:Aminotransferase class I/classII large domain-containing protein n=1 Tax=Hohenbuehelia grisea TaxID=104357 RepID=A0ABR3ITY0_9AGAR